MRTSFTRSILFALAAQLAVLPCAHAAYTVDLLWDASPSDPQGLVYTVHYGNKSGQYTFESARTAATTLSIANIGQGQWFFVVKARYGDGPESDPSNEASIVLASGSGRVGLDLDGDSKSDTIIVRRTPATTSSEYRKMLSSRSYRLASLQRTGGRLMYHWSESGGRLMALSADKSALRWRSIAVKPRTRVTLPGSFTFAMTGCDFDGDGTGDYAGFTQKDYALTYRSGKTQQIVGFALAIKSGNSVKDLYCADITGDGATELFALLSSGAKALTVAVLSPTGALLREITLKEKGVSGLIVPPELADAGFTLLTIKRDAKTQLITDLYFRMLSAETPAVTRWHLRGGADDVSVGRYMRKTVSFIGVELLVGSSLARFNLAPVAQGLVPKLVSNRKLDLPDSGEYLEQLVRPVSVVRVR